MPDTDFEETCVEIARLAELVSQGTPEQIDANADGGWWQAMETLTGVYNDWLRQAA